MRGRSRSSCSSCLGGRVHRRSFSPPVGNDWWLFLLPGQTPPLPALPYALMRSWCTLRFEALRRLIRAGSRPARPYLALLLPLKRCLGVTSVAGLKKSCQKLQLRARGDEIRHQGQFGSDPISFSIFLFFILLDKVYN